MQGLIELLQPGQRIWVAGSSNEPTGLLHGLREMSIPEDLTFIQFPLPGYNNMDFSEFSDSARVETFFMSPIFRNAAADRFSFIPMQMRSVFDYLAERVDVVLIQAAYDRDGKLRTGPNLDFVDAACGAASTVIAEVNRSFQAPLGCPLLDESSLSFRYESDRPLYEMPAPSIDDAARAIGALVAELIRDGDCIQTGIGSIPAAILGQLDGRNDLGLHGGLIDDGGMRLIRAGNINGSNKPLDRGIHTTGMALGSAGLFEWLGNTREVQFRGANYTHEVEVIRQLPQFVSINSAVEVDLFGQVNAEYAGGRQLSGTGGSVDFMRAAKASPGGRSIIAMNATARAGSVSRIVSRVEMVTALRTDVDMVVTEYGVAQLAGRSLQERAESLIAIAAPDFRGALRDQAPI